MAGRSSQADNRGADLFGLLVSGKGKEFHTYKSSATDNSAGMVASGGFTNVYPEGASYYKSHIFETSGTLTVTTDAIGLPMDADVLVVAGGGGGGGRYHGGGGGAGGFRTTTGVTLSAATGTYTVTVGAGGIGGSGVPASYRSGNGTPSTFPGTTSQGGGGGGDYPNGACGNGGSGGGGNGGRSDGGSGNRETGTTNPAPSQGNDGGDGVNYGGAGGGGAGGVGSDGTANDGGAGGAGSSNVYAYGPTNPKTYAGGGGGATFGGNDGGAGGTGGGGDGSPGPSDATAGAAENGVAGTGGGGGGNNGYNPVFLAGGMGGSGTVVVRYRITASEFVRSTAKASGGAVSFYGGKTIHTFTGSGTFTAPGSFNETVEYFVVGGGGAGGGQAFRGGGGGAGTILHNSVPIDNTGPGNPTVSNIVIGGGGSYAYVPGADGQGASTTIAAPFSLTAPGGGQGGGYSSPYAGQPGGSGGGAGGYPGGSGGAAGTDPGPATGDPFPGNSDDNSPANGWGYAGGGRGDDDLQQGGGGGGAGGQGIPSDKSDYPGTYGYGGPGIQVPSTFRDPNAAPSGTGGTGGAPTSPGISGGLGVQNPTGTGFYVGGGGNGGGYAKTEGVNPSVATFVPAGGGGYGAIDGPGNAPEPTYPYYRNGHPGVENTGSGGGGASIDYEQDPGHGGSGLVLIAYPT